MKYGRTLKITAVPKALCCIFGLVLSVAALFPRPEMLFVQFVSVTAMRSFLYGLLSAFLFIA